MRTNENNRRKSVKRDFASLSVIIQLAMMLAAAVYNLLYSLNVEGTVSETGVYILSYGAIASYAAAAALTLHSGRRDIAAIELVLWSIALAGFGFYAADELFGLSIIVPDIEMTAFLRLLTVIFTLPMISYNIIIFSAGSIPCAFILALMPTLTFFIIYTAAFVKFRRDKKISEISEISEESGNTQ